jgi:hypothetical protein
MSNKKPKLFVIEKKTPSGKSWSKVIVDSARDFASAAEKLISIQGKTGEYRIRRLKNDSHPSLVLAVKDFGQPETPKSDLLAFQARRRPPLETS